MTSAGWYSPSRAWAKRSCSSSMAAGVSIAETVWKRTVSLPSGSVWVIEFSMVFQRPAGTPVNW
jgi:hypothetical protein